MVIVPSRPTSKRAPKNRTQIRVKYFNYLPLCRKLKKTNDSFLRKKLNCWTDRQQWFYKVILHSKNISKFYILIFQNYLTKDFVILCHLSPINTCIQRFTSYITYRPYNLLYQTLLVVKLVSNVASSQILKFSERVLERFICCYIFFSYLLPLSVFWLICRKNLVRITKSFHQ